MVLHIYAEHLVHIRTLSIQASLASASNSSTRALICADGKTVLLTHTGENARLVLPACVPASLADTELRISQYASKDINFRIPLGDSANGPSDAEQPKHSILGDYDNTTPWSARVLNSNVQISCLQCQTIVAERGSIKLWKDLPSENWAEMMDFWHCHRPHVPHDAQGALKKGYAADSKLALVPSVGMVDHSHFVLHPHDCRNLESIDEPISEGSNGGSTLKCTKCRALIGSIDLSSDGHKLRKSRLALSLSPEQPPVFYEAELWLTSHLLNSISTQGVQKFTVVNSTSPSSISKYSSQIPNPINIWIFTPDLKIASTASPCKTPLRVAKILWKDSEAASAGTDEGRLDRKALSQGHIEIPEDEMIDLQACLEGSARLLPEGGREFQGWRVALMERF